MEMQALTSILYQIKDTVTDYECYAINKENKTAFGYLVDLPKDTLLDFMKNTLSYLLTQQYTKMKLGTYPQDTPKEYIESLNYETNASSIEFVNSVRNIKQHQEQNVIDFSKYKSYVIKSKLDGKDIIFFTNKKIIKNYNRNNYIYSKIKGKYSSIDSNLIRLIMHFDCILIDKTIYITTLEGRDLIGLTASNKEKSLKNIEIISESHIVSDEQKSTLSDYAKGRKASCLANADIKLVEIFKNITDNNKDYIEKKYGLNVIKGSDEEYHIDLSTREHISDFILTITHKRAKDFDNGFVYSSTPFSHLNH